MRQLIFLFLIVVLAFSCKPKATVEESTSTDLQPVEIKMDANLQHYEDEIMKIHDDAMPKMSDIQRLSSQLRDIKSKAGETEDGTPVQIEGLDDALTSLREAEQGMMDWMKLYSETKPRVTQDIIAMFYERELEKITHVRENMLNSIEKANKWLAQYSGNK